MIGQASIIQKINNSTLDTFPQSLILLGEKGSGRHSICDIISKKFNVQLIDITHNITQENIENIYLRVEPYFYFIDLTKITVREENMILKFVEEPLKNSFIIFITETRNTILHTILNRCQIWELEKYSYEDLYKFISDESFKQFLDICTTPGQVIDCQRYCKDIAGINDLTNKMVRVIANANFANILTIGDKINFKSDYDATKYDFEFFVKMLISKLRQMIVNSNNVKLFTYYARTNKLLNDSKILHINKQHLFENYLDDVKCIMRG